MLAALTRKGFTSADFGERADVYIVNSCTVTAEADHKSRRLARGALRRNPDALVVVAGCYASEASSRAAKLPDDILLVPASAKETIADAIAERLGAVEPLGPPPRTTSPVKSSRARTRAMVKIQDGCDNFCAYCVAPFARGAPRSRPLAQVLGEVDGLVAAGVAEVVLSGINLGRYEADGFDLPGLVRRVLETGVRRLRLSSVEPQHLTDDLIELLGREERVCPHLHLPLQSGSDAVLARMGRSYTGAVYLAQVRRATAARGDLALTTDVIVGFPGETEVDFDATVALLRQAAPLRLHVFKYSPRPRTSAADLSGQVDQAVKRSRAKRLAELGEELGASFVEALIGTEQEVLVESVEDGVASGFAPNYVRCFFKGDESARGTIVRMTATRRDGIALLG